MSEDETTSEKKRLYDPKSFWSAVIGGITGSGGMKLLDWGQQKFSEYRRRKMEYERKEEERRLEVYAGTIKEALDKYLDRYFHDKRQSQPE